VSPRARQNADQLKPTWLTAAVTPKTSISPTAGRHRSPSAWVTRSSANRARPTPNGAPHISEIRLDFTKTSNSVSGRSFTAAIAGYSVWVTIWSTRSEYWTIDEASVIAPTPASPSFASPASTVPWEMTIVLSPPTATGPEKRT